MPELMETRQGKHKSVSEKTNGFSKSDKFRHSGEQNSILVHHELVLIKSTFCVKGFATDGTSVVDHAPEMHTSDVINHSFQVTHCRHTVKIARGILSTQGALEALPLIFKD